ncbi:hypothetical protein ACWCXH_38905 [Kitasatospora sp. NPDC001660]
MDFRGSAHQPTKPAERSAAASSTSIAAEGQSAATRSAPIAAGGVKRRRYRVNQRALILFTGLVLAVDLVLAAVTARGVTGHRDGVDTGVVFFTVFAVVGTVAALVGDRVLPREYRTPDDGAGRE